MERQVRLWKYSAERIFVGVGVIEDFDNLRNKTAIEEKGNDKAEVLFSHPKEQRNDKQYGNAYENKMAHAKQSGFAGKDRSHKTPLL